MDPKKIAAFIQEVSNLVDSMRPDLNVLRQGRTLTEERQRRAGTALQTTLNILEKTTRTFAIDLFVTVAGTDDGTRLRLGEVFKSLLHAMSRMQYISDHSSDQYAKQLAEQARRELVNAWVVLTLIMTGLPKGNGEPPDSVWILDTLATILSGDGDFTFNVAAKVAELKPEPVTMREGEKL